VVAVLTAQDIPGEHNHGLVIKDWPSLVGRRGACGQPPSPPNADSPQAGLMM
jgi:hypothetical protein